jgi:hypothetical protein
LFIWSPGDGRQSGGTPRKRQIPPKVFDVGGKAADAAGSGRRQIPDAAKQSRLQRVSSGFDEKRLMVSMPENFF